jgi:hypothetical protein
MRRAALVTAGPRTCRRCQTVEADPQVNVCSQCRSLLRGHRKRQTHGLSSRPELHPDTARLFVERVDHVLADAGYSGTAESAPYTYGSQARDFVRLELLVETGFAAVADAGSAGKVIDQLNTLIATKARLAGQLGLKRKARPTTPLAAVLAAHEDASNG